MNFARIRVAEHLAAPCRNSWLLAVTLLTGCGSDKGQTEPTSMDSSPQTKVRFEREFTGNEVLGAAERLVLHGWRRRQIREENGNRREF